MPSALLPLNYSERLKHQALILQNLNEAAIVTDTDWRIQIWNRAAESLYGWQDGEVQGRSLWEAIPALRYLDCISRVEAIAHLYQYSRWQGKIVQQHKNGREIAVESSAGLILDERGATVGIITVNRPLLPKACGDRLLPLLNKQSKRKVKEKNNTTAATLALSQPAPDCQVFPHSTPQQPAALHPQNPSFRLIADKLSVMLWMSGTDFLCTFFNQAWLEFTGRSLEEELGTGWAKSVHPEDLQQCMESYRQIFESRQPFKIAYRLRRFDGQYRWILDAGVPLTGTGGEFVGYVGSCIDITEYKTAEISSNSQQEFFRTVLDAIPHPLFVKDEQGKLVFANRSFGEICGSALENPTGKTPGNGAIALQETFILSGERRWFESLEKPLTSFWGAEASASAATYLLGVKSDITHRVQVEEALQKERNFVSTVLDAAPVLAVACDREGRIVRFNRCCEQTTGYSFEEVKGKRVADLFLLAGEMFQVTGLGEDNCAGNIPQQCENYWLTKAGDRLRIAWWNTAWWNADGSLDCIIATGIDISDRDRAETALRQALEELESRVEERTAALRESNDRLVEEIVERFRAEKELRQHKEQLKELVKERTAELEKTNQQLRQEIVERKRVEQALFQEKELAQITLQSIGDAAIATDALGRITSMNRAAERLTGWPVSEALGKSAIEVFRIVDEATRLPIENLVETALQCQPVAQSSDDILLLARDGKEVAINRSLAPIRTSDGQILGAVLVFHDVTEERALARRLSWQATHDSLTGLVNRREFEQHLKSAWLSANSQDRQHALCYLDLDRFKYVNDTCGHLAGDELLRQISSLLQGKVRKTDTLARLGGDEFGLLLLHCSPDGAAAVANDLRQSIQEFRFLWEDKTYGIGVSIGLVGIDANSSSPASLLSAADAACYEAKSQGRDRVQVYQLSEKERSRLSGDRQWAVHLPKALEADRFRLYHQPIISLCAAESYSEHYEVLLRLEDESGNLVSPTAFLPAAERYNLMPAIDRWVIRTLFESQGQHYRQAWNRCQSQGCQCLYTINLSGASLNDDRFIDFLTEQLSLHEIPPSVLCFEITETVAIGNLSKAAALVGALKALGCRFTLDDFGNNVSCLAYLRNLPVDYLKIDGNFVKNIVSDPINAAIVEATNQIGHLMGLQTIAEFVENDAILAKLRAMGVDYAQGYAIAKPHPLPFQPRH